MVIIAISGKIGSGKDTIGSIIQYLTLNKEADLDWTYQEYLDDTENDKKLGINHYAGKDFIIKKFADKLKDIVCLLIGCTREQLEDAEFKNKELGEEWWYYKFKVLHNTYKLIDYLNNDLTEEEIKLVNPRYLVKPTPRLLLQQLGTDCGRNIIHPNIWVNSLMSEYKSYYTSFHEGIELYPNWIITDTRFPNELEAVKKRRGISIRVNRVTFREQNTEFGKLSTVVQPEVDKLLGIQEHPSETALDNATFDYTIDNNSTVEELIEKVKEILIKEKVI